MIGTITLNPSIDRHLIVSDLVKDDANRALEVIEYPGGKGVNVSKVVRELGGKTKAYALLGGLSGMLLEELVEKLDIPLAKISIQGNTRINTILTDRKDGTQTRISSPGPKMKKSDLEKFEKLLLSTRPKPFLWALGGSLSHGMKPATYRDLILHLQKKGVPCVLDTDNEALKEGVKAKPFIIKPNEYEMQRLVGRRLSSIGQYFQAGKKLAASGIRIVIISLGERGALFVTGKESFYLSIPKVKVKSKVGAGDSLIGGMALGLSRRMSLVNAAKLGVAASLSAVMREAPRLCLKSDIPVLLPQIRCRKL